LDNSSIVPLFSTPVYSCDLSKQIIDSVTPFLKDLEYHCMDPSGKTNTEFYTTNKFVLDLPECRDLKQQVLDGIRDYAQVILCVTDQVEFYITNSWTNRIEPGGGAGNHTHGNSIISGVIYLDTEEDSGDLIVHKDYNAVFPFPPQFTFDYKQFNIYNTKVWNFPPSKYRMVLFPSGTMHSISLNCTDIPRWSLAFNTFVKGSISNVPLRQLYL
jgi:uncharacterized protein (TIGR02466 family)